ncbi:DUF2591 domain-containing protein [Lelliottia amnigena]|uniref:phage protein NinX family protein n=1 Tax=Lelliottia amnigena TaxID=61646 RepID=UPI00103E8295|nr:phage protein NinX family protein [Lelliottia amnigena]TCD25009.1 DUF2591 domain-containing protein [Lelliottia amnigena]
MDYSKMSDFEVNKAVAEIAINGDWFLEPTDGSPYWHFNHGVQGKNTVKLPNYCNNPADAWPIISGNLIALRPVEKYVGGYRWFATKGEGDFGAKCADENPLRAAMCLFLMMQESTNVPANTAGPDIRR